MSRYGGLILAGLAIVAAGCGYAGNGIGGQSAGTVTGTCAMPGITHVQTGKTVRITVVCAVP